MAFGLIYHKFRYIITKGKFAGDAVELSRLKLEHLKLKNRVRENYERLGEIVYGGYKNKEDVSDVIAVLYEQLDEDFANIERLFDAMNAVKAGYASYAEAKAADEDDDADEDYEAEDEPAGEENSADPEIEKEINEMMDEAEKAAKADEAFDIDAD